MSNELISVIVPIYNVELYLRKCIDSIINQTYKNIEIILIDDGSTDNSGIICDEYKELDNRIVVIHKSNGGLSSARNKGLDIVRGNIICFVDSDDYIEYNMLEELKKNMDKYQSDISICNYYYVTNKKKIKYNDLYLKKEFFSIDKTKFVNLQNEFENLTTYSWNKLYKKELFDNIKFPDGKVYEDLYIICDLLDKAQKVSYLLDPLYNYVFRKNSITNSFGFHNFDKVNSYNKKILFFNRKGYYDLVLKEQSKKMDNIITNLSKMKRYKIKNKEVFNKYYKELLETNKDVKWKDANKKVKLFKIFRRSSISTLAVMYRVRDLVKR